MREKKQSHLIIISIHTNFFLFIFLYFFLIVFLFLLHSVCLLVIAVLIFHVCRIRSGFVLRWPQNTQFKQKIISMFFFDFIEYIFCILEPKNMSSKTEKLILNYMALKQRKRKYEVFSKGTFNIILLIKSNLKNLFHVFRICFKQIFIPMTIEIRFTSNI